MNINLMKKRRKELGLTQQELADKCGLSRVSISNYESGKAEPTIENIDILAKVLSVRAIDLFKENARKIAYENGFGGILEKMRNNALEYTENIIKNSKYKVICKTPDKLAHDILEVLYTSFGMLVLYSKELKVFIFFDKENDKFFDIKNELFDFFVLNMLSLVYNLKKDVKIDNEYIEEIFLIEEISYHKFIENINKRASEYETKKIYEYNKKRLKEIEKLIEEGGSDE